MKLSIETPDRKFYDDAVEAVVLTTPEGEIGVLDSHMLMVVALDTAPMRLKEANAGEWRVAVLSGGFAHIKGTEVVVLTDSAVWEDEIELVEAEEAKKTAEEEMRTRQSEIEFRMAEVELKKALLMINMAGRGKH